MFYLSTFLKYIGREMSSGLRLPSPSSEAFIVATIIAIITIIVIVATIIIVIVTIIVIIISIIIAIIVSIIVTIVIISIAVVDIAITIIKGHYRRAPGLSLGGLHLRNHHHHLHVLQHAIITVISIITTTLIQFVALGQFEMVE